MIWKYSYSTNNGFRSAPIPDPPYIDLEDEDEEELEETEDLEKLEEECEA